MQVARLVILALILAAAPVTGLGQPAAFGVPSQWSGNLAVDSDWILLVAGPSDVAEGHFQGDGQTLATQHTAVKTRVSTGLVGFSDVKPVGSSAERIENLGAALTGPTGKWKSLYLEAEELEVRVVGNGSLQGATAYSTALSNIPGFFPIGTVRLDGPTLPAASAVFSGAFSDAVVLEVLARGIRHLEMHNFTLSCRETCPSESESLPAEDEPIRVMQYLDLAGPATSSLNLTSSVVSMATGGATVNATVAGQVRLTRFTLGTCPAEGCTETLVANGTMLLREIAMDSQTGQLRAHVQLAEGAARLDETIVDAGLLGAGTAAAVVVAAGIWFGAKLLGALFTRIASESVLDHPRRELIRNAVAANPGLSLNELLRRTYLSNGTARHHIRKLRESGHLEVRRLAGRVRLYPRGTDEAEARTLAAKDGPMRRALLTAIQRSPGITQAALLTNFPDTPRSSVQFHLRTLERGGLVQKEKSGRSVRYFLNSSPVIAVEVSSPRVPA